MENCKKFLKILAAKAVKFFKFYIASRVALVATAVILGLAVTVLFGDLTIAYNVHYNGAFVGTVRQKSDYEPAMVLVQQSVESAELGNYMDKPHYLLTFTSKKNISAAETLAKNIIENTDSIALADAVLLNGEVIGCIPTGQGLKECYENCLNRFNPEGVEVSASFVDDVKLVSGYYTTDSFCTLEQISEKLNQLSVQTTVVERCQTAIPFSTTTRKSADRYVDEYVRVVSGVNGVEESVQKTTYINGVQTNKEFFDKTVVKEPVNAVVVVGTKKRPVSADVLQQVGELGLIWPLKRVENQVITAYWGDGRNHKGLDIASPRGTHIYAAQSGTVITSGYSSSYGNHVIIDHGNGYTTLYAHASAKYVSVGEYVEQGEMIAAVGSTGNSTGNHLHFEIRKNGTRVNPAPYLGL